MHPAMRAARTAVQLRIARGRYAAHRSQGLLATKAWFTTDLRSEQPRLRNGPQDRRSVQDRRGPLRSPSRAYARSLQGFAFNLDE